MTQTGSANDEASPGDGRTTIRRIPRLVWALGLVSLCMNISSEMIHALLPVFLVSVLGASTVTLGLIEGIAEATASITKIFSGALSDWLGRRKPLAVLGYGLAALTKPMFPLATSAGWVLTARFIDRIGKGIRGAPRDALVADATPPEMRGAAYGLRQSLDTVGAFLGPLGAIGLMLLLADRIRLVFWIAAIPAAAAVAILVFAVKEPAQHAGDGRRRLPRFGDLGALGSACWTVVGVGAVFSLARFSEAFLLLRAYEGGLSLAWTPLAMVVMNLAYFASAYPVGRLSDRIGRTGLLAAGLVTLIVGDGLLALGQQLTVLMVGIAVWGLHMGLTQGLLAAMVADAAPKTLRGSAFGAFNFVGGLATLVASLLAGELWNRFGAPAAFWASAALAAVALAGLLWVRARRR